MSTNKLDIPIFPSFIPQDLQNEMIYNFIKNPNARPPADFIDRLVKSIPDEHLDEFIERYINN